MAEAAGLAIGGIALASLFSSCVEFLEYFENGRDWLYDFSLALTKVNLMKVRLYKLEYNRRIAETSLEGRDVLQIKLQQENGAISHGLSGITEILEKTTELCRKYSYNATTNDIHKAPINETRDCINHTALSFTQPRSKPKSLSIISKKVAWTLHDKKKFDGLISDFEFILSNLERIDDGQAIDKYSKEGSPKEDNPSMAAEQKLLGAQENPSEEEKITFFASSANPIQCEVCRLPKPHSLLSTIASSAAAVTAGSPSTGVPPFTTTSFTAFCTCLSTYIGNHSYGQSFHLLGSQADDKDINGGSKAANYFHNNSYDQSFKNDGPIGEKNFAKALEQWTVVAKYGVDKKTG